MTTEPTGHLPEVQRWSHEHPTECIPVRYDEGDWIRYADHVAALRACEERVAAETISRLDRWQQHSPLGRKTYEEGVQAARDAVAALDPRYDGEWRIKYADAIAAIDAIPR